MSAAISPGVTITVEAPYVPPPPPPTYALTIGVDKTRGYVGDTFTFAGRFTKNGAGLVTAVIDLVKDGVIELSTVTDAGGYYTIPWIARAAGTFTFHTEGWAP